MGTNTSSSVLLLSHVHKKQITKVEEMTRYTIVSCISDIGGILGIFLGISFWSIYSDFIAPFLDRIENSLRYGIKMYILRIK